MEWKHRGKWTGNRFLWIVYRLMRIQLMSIWLYFIPFIGLALSFIVPYFVEPEREALVSGSSMDQEYEDYLANVLS